MAGWADCPAVESSLEKVGGAWLFRGTRVPVRALFEHLLLPSSSPFATVERFLEWFPGVSQEQVDSVLAFETTLDGALRLAFPDAQFSVACTHEEIVRAEAELGVSIPDQLRDLYLESDGFYQDNSVSLSSVGGLVYETEKLWGLGEVLAGEQLPDMKPFVFFGTPYPGGWLGIRYTPPFNIVSWLPNEPELKPLGSSIVGVLKAEHVKYMNQHP